MIQYPAWFALTVKPRHERLVSQRLCRKGFEEFLPLHRPNRVFADRRKPLDQPLFPGYVFCRACDDRWLSILRIPGVSSIVSNAHFPEPVPEHEIESVRMAVDSGLPLRPSPSPIAGQQVRVESGALANLRGVLVRHRDALRIVIRISALRQSVAVDVPRDMVCAVDGSAYAPTAQLYLTA